MPSLRSATPAPRVTRKAHVLLYAPKLYELGFKQQHIDGDALALYAHLEREGFHCTLLDAYYRALRRPTLAEAIEQVDRPVDIVLVHLWTSDAYGSRLRGIADELAAVRRIHGLPVIAFGPLAVSAADELRAHGTIDRAVGLESGQHLVVNGSSAADDLDIAIGRYLRSPAPLTSLTYEDLPYMADAVVSVSASRGCRGRCTFCAYNADLGGGWLELPIKQAVSDIAHLRRLTGAKRFALADSDFGGTKEACRQRARELLQALADHNLVGQITLSINVRSETLEPETVRLLAAAGVKTMLIGVESLDDRTLHRLYGKHQDIPHLTEIVNAADQCGITAVASYILWHPWQTMESIRLELGAIETFGRWRIPQFMARSRLLVIPGTVIEQKIRQAGLLEAAPFERQFRFAEPEIHKLYGELAEWFEKTVMPVLTGLSEQRADDLATLAELKIAEWQWLVARAGLTGASGDG
jgi:Radical SAM superfamily